MKHGAAAQVAAELVAASSGTAMEALGATEALVQQAMAKASSVTYKRAYDRFLRKMVNQKNMNGDLSQAFVEDKHELFNQFLEAGRALRLCDWPKRRNGCRWTVHGRNSWPRRNVRSS